MAAGPVAGLLPGLSSVCFLTLLSDLFPDLLFNRLSVRLSRLPE